MFNYEVGINAIRELPLSTELRKNFETEIARLQENQKGEILFGSSENTRRERSQIIYALNSLALEYLKVSFNEMCVSGTEQVFLTCNYCEAATHVHLGKCEHCGAPLPNNSIDQV